MCIDVSERKLISDPVRQRLYFEALDSIPGLSELALCIGWDEAEKENWHAVHRCTSHTVVMGSRHDEDVGR
jgi:hypothetical protein